MAAAVVVSLLRADAPASDLCRGELPAAITSSVVQEFPGYRLPQSSDNLAEDIDYYSKQGRSGCLGAMSGDFNGDKATDYALLVTRGEKESLLLVALRFGEGWTLEKLRNWNSDRSRLYLTPASPGAYKRATYLADSLEAGEVTSFVADRVGIVTGRTEASGIYYFWTPHGWVHVWVVD